MNHEELVLLVTSKIYSIRETEDIDKIKNIIAKYRKLFTIYELDDFRYLLERRASSVVNVRKYYWGL